MKLQKLLSYTRKAVDTYQMILDGDKIAIGISGGKDSLALLYALNGLRRFYSKSFDICAITVDLGFKNFNLEPVMDLCQKLDVPYHVVKTDIGAIVFDERKEKNPCSLCSKMRKGALNNKASELGCNKIAYGHHKDDVVETMLLSMIFEGRMSCFSPITHLERSGLDLIRPLIFASEAELIGFKNKYDLPVCKNPCPADGNTQREYVKNLTRQLNHDHPGSVEHMFNAVVCGNLEGWHLPL